MPFPYPQGSFFRAVYAFRVTWSERFVFLPAVRLGYVTKKHWPRRPGRTPRRDLANHDTPYTLFTPPPPPFPPAAPALSLIFLGTTVILGRNWRQWLWKLLGDKQGYAYYGQCENGEFSPFNKTIWCLICFVVYQIYADTLWSRSHH